jgi:hypothetical protein
MQLLKGHVSPETAYVVDDYPYGFRLRCKIRYWIEYKPKTGFRFVSQTTNPKKAHCGEIWNKPKASTYCKFAAAMYLNSNGHVEWNGVHEYSDTATCIAFRDKFGDAIPEAGRHIINEWIAAKSAYDKAREPHEADGSIAPLNVGLKEAREAFVTEAIKNIKQGKE